MLEIQLTVGHQVKVLKIKIRFISLIIAQFTGPHVAYTNSICWLKGSYYLPTEESMFEFKLL
jgi:hypothetical protein